MAKGHNSGEDVLNGTAQSQLRTIISRIERLEVDKAEIMADQKEVFSEAKGNGFDVKIIRKIIRLRKQDTTKRLEEEAITDLYLSAIGDGPAFEAAAAADDDDEDLA